MSKNICDNMSEISIVVVGDSQCGKTQLINRFANGCFSEVSWGFDYQKCIHKNVIG